MTFATTSILAGRHVREDEIDELLTIRRERCDRRAFGDEGLWNDHPTAIHHVEVADARADPHFHPFMIRKLAAANGFAVVDLEAYPERPLGRNDVIRDVGYDSGHTVSCSSSSGTASSVSRAGWLGSSSVQVSGVTSATQTSRPVA